MVTMMAVYPGHLHHTGYGLGITSIIVSAHVCSMFAASPLLGRWTDRYGANRVAALGAATIATSCMLTTTLPTGDARIAALALILLGVGWNAQLVAGSALLTADTRTDSRRAQLESHGEIAMSAAAAAGALVLAPLLISQTSIRTLAGTMIPLHAIVIASTTSVLPRRHRQSLRLRVSSARAHLRHGVASTESDVDLSATPNCCRAHGLGERRREVDDSVFGV
jgi:MFS family permease